MTHSLKQLVKFIIVGSLAALVHGLILFISVRFFSIAPAWANVIAFSIAFIVSFIGHSRLTFSKNLNQSKPSANPQRLGKWFSVSLLGFGLNQGLFVLGLAGFGEAFYLLIWLVVTVIVTISSYLLGKLWAFKY